MLTTKRVHREVIGWLKEWDKCVFKRANPPKKRRLDDESNPYVSDRKAQLAVLAICSRRLMSQVDHLGRPKDRVSFPLA